MEDHSVVESVLDNLPVAVFAKDATDEFRFILWNKKQEEVTTISAERALGKNDYSLFSLDSADYFRSVDKAVIKRGTVMKVPEEIIETKNGREVHLRTVKIPVHDKETGRLLVVGISEDITEQVKAREQLEHLNRDLVETNRELLETQMQLIQAEKLESIGRLAAGVAHEVKNPLALLLLGVDYLAQGIEPDDPNVAKILSQMRDAVDRADRIVRGLVDFSSQRALSREPVQLAHVVEEVLLLVKHELTRSNTKVSVKIDKNLPLVFLDMSKFEQVLINLIINAVHSMEDRSPKLLKIRARAETLDNVVKNEGARKREVFRSGDKVVILDIIDSGAGISPNDASRLFDPFFTTKATGKGTGLGLSVARRIVELHGGNLALFNRSGEPGAVARLTLPTKLETGKVRTTTNPTK
ncbi:MAG: PAS domain-containing protein [Verrucomicrobiales bacterium]|jgi:PAS domain S-box-containing protein|nr:PAS domain-containing protein [Verrucomicrobiales bacterium]MBP9223514.1 PAS domain-containing protein [Verrucomicrobiales bacterium]